MYVRVGELKRPLSIRYAYVLTRLHFHPFGWRLFVGSLRILLLFDGASATAVAASSFSAIYIQYACMFSLHFRTVAGWWAQITVYNSASFVRILLLLRGGIFHHTKPYTHVRIYMYVCVPFFILTFVCPYLVIIPCTCQPANQPTNRQSWSATNGSFVCTHFGIIVCLLQMEKLMYVMS